MSPACMLLFVSLCTRFYPITHWRQTSAADLDLFSDFDRRVCADQRTHRTGLPVFIDCGCGIFRYSICLEILCSPYTSRVHNLCISICLHFLSVGEWCLWDFLFWKEA